MAATPETATISLAEIDKERADIVKKVIDGLPVAKTYDVRTTGRFELLSRIKPSVESITLSQEFCDSNVDLDTLKLDARVAELLSHAPLKSPSFNMRLLELVAIAIHDMAGNLFASHHPGGEPDKEKLDKTTYPCDISLSAKPYFLSDKYPRGVSDVVGYWAETYIFGGVVVFDRGPDEEARECNGAYIHPPYSAGIFGLSERQLEEFASHDVEEMFIIPFDSEPGTKKVDPTKAFLEFNIYRDRYERDVQPPSVKKKTADTK